MRRLAHVVPAVLIATLLLGLALTLGYAPVSFEALVLLLAAAVLGGAVAWLVRGRERWAAAAKALLLLAIVDIFFIESDALAWALLALGTWAAVRWRHQIDDVAPLVFCGVFLAGLHATGDRQDWVQTAPVAKAAPAGTPEQLLVHLVLDELGSLESIPPEFRDSAQIDDIRRAYQRRGFTIHADIVSSSNETYVSLSELVRPDAGAPGQRNYSALAPKNAYKVDDNALHRLFADNGWKVWITQSSYLDFCASPAFRCTTYPLGNHMRLFGDAGVGHLQRLHILAQELHQELSRKEHRSVFVRLAQTAWPAWKPQLGGGEWTRPSLSLMMLDVLDRQMAEVAQLQGRNVVFAHLLLPHFPWILDGDCRVAAVADWRSPYKARNNGTAADLRSAFDAYWRQQLCTHRRVLQAVDAIDARHAGRAQVLIHGDHGARILTRGDGMAASEGGPLSLRQRNALEPMVISRLGDAAAPAQQGGQLQPWVREALARIARQGGR